METHLRMPVARVVAGSRLRGSELVVVRAAQVADLGLKTRLQLGDAGLVALARRL